MLNSELKQTIQGAYRQFLDNRKLAPRHGQKLMIADVARVLANISKNTNGERIESDNPHIAILEAGTGTGKTVAYLLGAIPVAQALNKKLVISTATIALQEQIVHKDLPDVKNNTDLNFNFSLAKGRGRYLCLSKLDRLLMESEAQLDANQALYEDELPMIDEQTIPVYQSMVDALAAGKWDGDRDRWPTEIEPNVWQPVTTNHRECTGRRCSNVGQCSFFKARDSIERFDVIVANHDLVLADLALGGGAILPEPKDTIYIFDEGHHLADKALSHFAHHVRVNSTEKWLDQVSKSLSSMQGVISDNGQIDHYAEQLPAALLEAKQNIGRIHPHCQQLMGEALLLAQDSPRFGRGNDRNGIRHRFENGQPPAVFVEIASDLHQSFKQLSRLLNNITTEIQAAMEDSYSQIPKVDLETWFPVVGKWLARAEANTELWASYSRADSAMENRLPLARWITFVEFSGSVDYEVCSSPILAAHTLKHTLWEPCYGSVVTSATLTALGKFERFQMRSGTDNQQHYGIMPSPFDFTQAVLEVPEFAIEANQTEAHTQSIIEHLPKILPKQQGSLVLFSSRRQMEEVHQALPTQWREKILMQGEYSKQAMLDEHKQAVDNGFASILFGLASFAEGIDLPGDYCKHVVIAKLPFAVPDDPIEASLAEWVEQNGRNAFMDITVPDAAIKLVQACGRLLRTETDTGVISILDKRVTTKRYGQLLLNALPPYTRRNI